MTAPISIQLYTLREQAKNDFPAVIRRLGEIGYVGIEPAGLQGLTAVEFRRLAQEAGLVIGSSHAQLPLGDDAEKILDEQQEIGNENLIVAFGPPERFASEDSVKQMADELNQGFEKVRARGMHLGYHNHYWEFQSEIGGRPAYDVFFEHLDPGIFAEVDVYWAKVGGQDPATVIAGLGPRARMLHLKDGPADDPRSAMTAVGSGTLDIAAIAATNPAVEWLIVELDQCDTDMFEAVEQSYRFLVGEGLAEGRK
jgi:sugar phosphate isomerase/epimerase